MKNLDRHLNGFSARNFSGRENNSMLQRIEIRPALALPVPTSTPMKALRAERAVITAASTEECMICCEVVSVEYEDSDAFLPDANFSSKFGSH